MSEQNSSILYSQSFPGGVARTLAGRLDETLSVKDFGAQGDGVTDDSAAFIEAIGAAAGSARLYVPEGIYILSRMLRLPSNSYIYGAGIDKSVLKMAASAPLKTSCMHSGAKDDKRFNIHLMDFTIDGNLQDRIGNKDGNDYVLKYMGGSCLVLCNTEYSTVTRLKLISPTLHCLDITGGTYYGSGTNTTNGNSFSVDSQPSRYITVADCYCEGGSDDNITTHQSSDIILRGCISKNPTGRLVSICGAYLASIEDVDCLGTGTVQGYPVKWQLSNQRSVHRIVDSRLYIGQDNPVSGDALQKTLSLYNVTDGRLQRVYLHKAAGSYGSVGLYAEEPNVQLCALYMDAAGSGQCSSFGNFTPRASNRFSCGSSSRLWTEVWAANGTIQTSDARLKEEIAPIDIDALRAWGKVELRQFLMADAVREKGSAKARLHMGLIAQQIIEAFESEGLNAFRYGLLCYDEWEDQYAVEEDAAQEAVYDEDTGKLKSPAVTREKRELLVAAGNRYSVRYEEALVMEAAYQRWENSKMQERLDVLEKRLLALEEL